METVLALAIATAILVAIPGPNVALIVARSVRDGFRAGAVASFGTTAGVALQLGLIASGVVSLVQLAAMALAIIKWLGVIYLFGLAIVTWRSPPGQVNLPVNAPVRGNFVQGLMIALLNPKTLLFNAAFLPQFIQSPDSSGSEMLLLCAVFLTVLQVGDLVWAAFANVASRWIRRHEKLRHRISAVFLAGAGLGLALSRKGL
jgi:threonine/homoserine/homoserine lactone efflux protein